MDIKEFFELSAGKWFAQRTHYDLAGQQAGSSKSEIIIEFLPSQAPEVLQLCQRAGVRPGSAGDGLKISWDNSVDWGKPKQVGFTLLVPIPDPERPQTGQLLRNSSISPEEALKGRYTLGTDKALTLTLQGETVYAEERLWFASPNLRLRASFVKNGAHFHQSAFYSEIRRLPPTPSDSPATT
jgi:phycoerythrin-associated linker protein